MRMRNKPWAKPELDACPFFLRKPEQQKGQWAQWFPREQPVHLELGCGKGWFLAGLAPEHPEINYIGIDLKDTVLAPAKRMIEASCEKKGLSVNNVALTAWNIELLMNIMDGHDRIERIYINFCNPWPKGKHKKRRLTYPTRLAEYAELLVPGGEIWFKTDDDGLYADSLEYFAEAGYTVLRKTEDLHGGACGDFFPGVPVTALTEHEKMFLEKGIKIKAVAAGRPTDKKEQ